MTRAEMIDEAVRRTVKGDVREAVLWLALTTAKSVSDVPYWIAVRKHFRAIEREQGA